MVCYTFGAPRVGNRAWASECGDLVPAMFHVINDQVPPQLPAYPSHGRPGPGLALSWTMYARLGSMHATCPQTCVLGLRHS